MLEALKANVLFIQFVVILALVLVDLVLAVARALSASAFDWGKFLLFLKQGVLAYAVVWGVLAGIGYLATYLDIGDPSLQSMVVLVNTIYAAIVAKLLRDIYDKLRNMGIEPSSDL